MLALNSTRKKAVSADFSAHLSPQSTRHQPLSHIAPTSRICFFLLFSAQTLQMCGVHILFTLSACQTADRLLSAICYSRSERYRAPYTMNRKRTRSCLSSWLDLDGLYPTSCIAHAQCFSLDLPDTWLYYSALQLKSESGAEK